MNLVTGATGLLGTHLMYDLLSRGERVRGMKRAGSNLEIVKSVFKFYPNGTSLFDSIQWCEGDVLDVDALQEAMMGCEFVYHCAAVVSYHAKDRDSMYLINVEGTSNVVNVALHQNITRLCFVSSIAGLGKSKPGEMVNEDATWTDSPFNTHYGITKFLSEMEVWRGIQEGLDAIVVNPGLIIGPGNFDRSSPSIFRKLQEGLSYFPPGGTGFIGVTDCASAMIDLMKKSPGGERYVLVAENLSMKEVFCEIALALEKSTPSKEATPIVLTIARIAEGLKELFTGRKALVTKESVKNASIRFYYENEKAMKCLGRSFLPIIPAIKETARFLKLNNH